MSGPKSSLYERVAADLEQPDGQYNGASTQHSGCEAHDDDEGVKQQNIVHVLLSCNRDNAKILV